MRLSWIESGLNLISGASVRGRSFETQRDLGEGPHEDRGRDSSQAAASQGTLKTARQPPGARRETRGRFSLKASGKNGPCQP